MKTRFLTKEEAQDSRGWVQVDATDKVVGRLASEIASILRGKTKPGYTPHNDCGDFVVVINAEKIRFTGQKEQQKYYHRHTGFIGSVKSESAAEVRQKHAERIIEHAVKGMLPHNALGRAQFRKLKVYTGAEHPHQAQQPQSA